MRKSLLVQLKASELSFIKELDTIYSLLKSDNYTYNYFYYSLKNSPYSMYFKDIDHGLYHLFKNNLGSYVSSNDFNYLDYEITNTINNYDDLTLDSFLNYLEFFKNLSNYKGEYRNNINVKQIIAIIENDCERLGYKFSKIGDNYKTILKNVDAEAVAAIVSKTTKDEIYHYLSIRPGNINEKRGCIKVLADDLESICKNDNNPDFSKVKHFAQCARHTKDFPFKEFPFYYEDEEKWLDNIFTMMIGVLSFSKAKELIKEIKKLENSNNGN